MQFLTIDTNGSNDLLLEYIKYEFTGILLDSDYSIQFFANERDNSILIPLESSSLGNKKIIEVVSYGISEYILDSLEEEFVDRIIRRNYCYFNPNERKAILKFAEKVLQKQDNLFCGKLARLKRKNMIIRELIDFFKSSNHIIVEGFVNFRLKEYFSLLEQVAEQAMNDFLAEKEYREFLMMLRYFVDIQEPKYIKVHIIPDAYGEYTILDDEFSQIKSEVEYGIKNDLSREDMLISSLITIAPLVIIIHMIENFENTQIFETLTNIFPGRLKKCLGCEFCSGNKRVEDSSESFLHV